MTQKHFARSVARKAKRNVKAWLGKDIIVQPEVSLTTLFLGTHYGGWSIYPDIIDAESTVYSFGVGEDISFDLALISRFGVAIEAFDPTPRSIHWVKQQNIPSQFHLHEYGLADFDGDISFNPPKNPAHVSHTILEDALGNENSIKVPVLTLGSILEKLGHLSIDLLKMDIEGAEYQVINDMLENGIFPKQLLVEFHHRFSNVGISKTRDALNKLSKVGYHIFDVSDSGEEFSFIFSGKSKKLDNIQS